MCFFAVVRQLLQKGRQKKTYILMTCVSQERIQSHFVATSKAAIEYIGKYNSRDEREADVMSSRCNTLTFKHQIPHSEAKEVLPCPHCFVELVMLGAEEE